MSIINSVLGYFSYDIGIDLGTANTLVFVEGKGIAIREPSVVARHKKTKEVIAIGSSAKKMVGRAPSHIETIRPLKDGVIADFDATQAMLTYYIKKVHESSSILPKIPRPKVVIGIPSGVTEVERRAVAKVALAAGAREAHLVEEPMAAAIGADLPVAQASGSFIVDIGGGTTEIGAISLGTVVVGKSVRIAGDEMDEAIIAYARLQYSLFIGQPTAEATKMAIGSAVPFEKEKTYTARGRDLETGLPKAIKFTATEIRAALMPIIKEITKNIKQTIEIAPPELISDIMKGKIVLAGGGSLLHGIQTYIAQETNMEVSIADDPLTCVVRGCGKLLIDTKLLKQIRVTSGF
jgi:rod shape-determining protein MreB